MANDGSSEKDRIMLLLLPYWTPLIPPLGISCLKRFLTKYDYEVKTFDANTEVMFREIYLNYFDDLKKYIPEHKQGNFYNSGNAVLRNHIMARFNFGEEEHLELTKEIIHKNYYVSPDIKDVADLDRHIIHYFELLKVYLKQLIEDEKPDIFGVSVYTGTLASSLFACKFVKENYPYIKTVMGGGVFTDDLSVDSPNFDTLLDKTPYIDKIIIGEGELLFLKLLGGELPTNKKYYTLEDIEGENLNLSSVDIPDFKDLNLSHYTYISSYASRSCPFQCSFCSETLLWGKYRKKEPRKISDELIKLSKEYKSQLILFGDSLLNPVITALAEEMIKKETSVYWDGYLRADKEVCDPEKALLWRKGGYYRARLGIESGSDKVLNLMGKKITPEQIKNAISSLAYAGIKTTTYWIVGYPGETEEDFQMTLNLIKELKNDIYEAECNPFNFYLSGQVGSTRFQKEYEAMPLYYEGAEKLLMIKSWILNSNPSREETYDRVNRFVEHCNSLGIPNPYTVSEIDKADKRWNSLHENAVPPLMDFYKRDAYIDENKKVGELMAKEMHNDSGDFNF